MHYLSAQDQKQVLRKDLKSKRCRLSLLPSVLKMNHDESPWGQGCTDIVATYVGHLVLWQASHATGDRQTYSFVCICIRNQKGVCQQTTIDGVVHWVWQGENCTTPSSMELFSNLIFSNVSLPDMMSSILSLLSDIQRLLPSTFLVCNWWMSWRGSQQACFQSTHRSP